MSAAPADTRRIETLLAIMARLRDPQCGCPWDMQQTFATIAPYTLEEAYEVADAIARNDLGDLKDELGDLLLQVVLHAQIAAEAQAFTFADVVDAICTKMIRCHPHVFAGAAVATADAPTTPWEEHKRLEREVRHAKSDGKQGLLDDIPLALPALTRALKLQKRAAQVGFDWRERARVLDKLMEEIVELSQVIAERRSAEKLTDEMGDILFVCVNLARHIGVDPETALRATNEKFARRFAQVEKTVTDRGQALGDVTLAEMDAAWEDAKRSEPGR